MAFSFLKVMPVIVSMGRVVLLVAYAYAVLGCELFADVNAELQEGGGPPDGRFQYGSDTFANFDDFRSACVLGAPCTPFF